MTTDTTIFGLRFKSDPTLVPSPEELKAFLDSPKEPGSLVLHRDDLQKYMRLLSDARDYDIRRQERSAQANFGARMFYGVLAHSHFISPVLQSVVEQYKFQLHALAALDFKKPTAFIKSAEEEMDRLNPKKKEEAARLHRFQIMVDERKEVLKGLTKRWAALVRELGHISQYIRDNLSQIEKLCEASIVILMREQIDRKKEISLIEDIKEQIKERLREALRQGTITKDHLEAAKAEVADLSKRTADFVRADVHALTVLYESVHEHARKIVHELDRLSAMIASGRTNLEGDVKTFSEIEKAMVSLVSDFRFKLQSAEIRMETEQDVILFEKRKEALDHLFDLLQN
jgi:hypothetical protein